MAKKNGKLDSVALGADKIHTLTNEIARHGGGRGYDT